jgi:hypothetical protein
MADAAWAIIEVRSHGHDQNREQLGWAKLKIKRPPLKKTGAPHRQWQRRRHRWREQYKTQTEDAIEVSATSTTYCDGRISLKTIKAQRDDIAVKTQPRRTHRWRAKQRRQSGRR